MVLVVVALVAMICYAGQSHYHRATVAKGKRAKARAEPEAYLQPKAELDAEDPSRNELEAENGEFELGGGERYEIEGDQGGLEVTESISNYGILASLMGRHELRGEEHSQELDGHGVGQ